jgi:hypothetical protein
MKRTTLFELIEKGHKLFLHKGIMGTSTLELKDKEKMLFTHHGTMNEIIIKKDIFVEPTDKVIIDGIIKGYTDNLSRNDVIRKGKNLNDLREDAKCLFCGKNIYGGTKKFCSKEHRRAYRKQLKQAKKKAKK